MKQSISLLFLLFNFVAFSQSQGKPTYFYLENQEIDKDQFLKLDERKTYHKEVVTDTAIFVKAYQHKNIGHLDSLQHNQINLLLKKNIGEKYNSDKKNMIHLYSKNDDKIQEDAQFKKYWRWISMNRRNYQSYLMGTKNSEIKADEKNNIYVDSYDILRKLFFKDSDFDLNHLLIKPSGEVYVFFGMDNILSVLGYAAD
ncbi:hypothetical protein ACFQ3R_05270 [Mesonia ostreae]|uniref:Uncharacterized protein n=1 Tax=Mesonia ostreae TaxID=861110 RepID=A0ABU2KK31_9FLAO|nr:hypothetical protein [Mesonia ostreae]MDT0295066.1 hypothetical protein [Mesonia ostreae]